MLGNMLNDLAEAIRRWTEKRNCQVTTSEVIAIVLDRPPAEAKALVDDSAAFTREMTRILREKQNHPLIAQMYPVYPRGME